MNKILKNKITNLFQKDQFEEGLKLLEKSDLSFIETLECKGNAEYYKRNYKKASAYYNQILEIDINYPLSRYCYL